ncbi:MAG: hypothetical protein AAB229_01035 [Candidatus Hydrogenedentota bacterium]
MIRSSIDIGTNSVRLLVTDPDVRPLKALVSRLRITRLGRGLDESGLISDESARSTVDAVADFAREAREWNSEPLLFGTAALREAGNGAEVAERIRSASGCEVRIVSGNLEALITFRGALLGLDDARNTMVLDIGGGSTEFITLNSARTGDTSRIGLHDIHAVSLKLGSVRQAERHLRSDPPAGREVDCLLEEVSGIVREGIAGRSAERLCGVAGSVTQLAALELEMETYDPDRINGYFLPLPRIESWIDRFARSTVEERRHLKGMVPQRAETVLAGTAILRETVRQLGLAGTYVSDFDSLWGALDGLT